MTEELKPSYISGNRIFILGAFDQRMAVNVYEALIKVVEEQSKKRNGRIQFFIDSHGGLVNCLFGILAVVEKAKKLDVIVETNVLAYAYSCASILAAAGTPGHRFIGEFAEHCCHLGSTTTGRVKNETELLRAKEQAINYFNNIRKLYKRYARIKKLDNAISFDNLFFRGQEIIDNGLADAFYEVKSV